MSHTITGSMGVIEVSPRSASGWDYRQTSVRVPLLSDGSSVRNEVLQQGSEPPLEAQLTGQFLDVEDVLTMREYYRTKEIVSFHDPVENLTHSCYVFEWSATRRMPAARIWEWTMTLVEASESGSGS